MKLPTLGLPSSVKERYQKVMGSINYGVASLNIASKIQNERLEKIKYITAYQTSPVSAITNIAEVAFIEPYGDGQKYKLNFAKPVRRFGPLQLGNAHGAILQGPRYTSLVALENTKDIGELF